MLLRQCQLEWSCECLVLKQETCIKRCSSCGVVRSALEHADLRVSLKTEGRWDSRVSASSERQNDVHLIAIDGGEGCGVWGAVQDATRRRYI